MKFPPMPEKIMKEQLAARSALIDRFLDTYLDMWPNTPERLKAAMLYSLQAGGKRLRPVLCLAAACLCGMDEAKAVPFASAIEMIHTYSLIHDDLPAMDNDDLRRGKPSSHKQFDEATAILGGDGLLADAFAVAAGVDAPAGNVLAALAELASAAGSHGMAGGQMLDMQYTGRSGVDIGQVAAMQALKTGAMIESSCVCGALLAGSPAGMLEALRVYGASFGKAFQIADDILDITGSTQDLGKPAGSDIARGKNTFPSLLGLEQSRSLAQAEAEKAMNALPDVPESAFLRGLAAYAVARRS